MEAQVPRLSNATFLLNFKCGGNSSSNTALFKFVDPTYEASYLKSIGITQPFEVLMHEIKHFININTTTHLTALAQSVATTTSMNKNGYLSDSFTKKNVHWPICPIIMFGDTIRIFCLILNIIQQQYTGPNILTSPTDYTTQLLHTNKAYVTSDVNNKTMPSNFTDLLDGGSSTLPNEVPESVVEQEASTYYWLYRNIWRLYDEDYSPIEGFGPLTFYDVPDTPGHFGFSAKG